MVPDVQKNRAEARGIMEKLGSGPDKRLAVKVSERNIAIFRDPAVILIDQLKEIHIDGELDPIETANWFPKIYRKDYQIGLNLTGVGVDDPDAVAPVVAVQVQGQATQGRDLSSPASLRLLRSRTPIRQQDASKRRPRGAEVLGALDHPTITIPGISSRQVCAAL